jgi:hypothetical protein
MKYVLLLMTAASVSLVTGCTIKKNADVSTSAAESPSLGPKQQPQDHEIPDGPLVGEIEATRWVAVKGIARVSQSNTQILTLSFSDSEQTELCPLVLESKRGLLTQVPKQNGSYPLGELPNILTATFNVRDESSIRNLVASQGQIVISEITPLVVKGALIVVMDDKTHVGGHFEIPLCDSRRPLKPAPMPKPIVGLDDRALGDFDLAVGGGGNQLKIESPKTTDRMYADFKYAPDADILLDLQYGSSGGFNCRPWGLTKQFEVIHFDASGNPVETNVYEGFPSALVFKANERYIVRHLVSKFPDFCEGITTSFIARKSH